MDGTTRKRWWTPFGLALLCAHCALGGVALAVSAGLLGALPVVLGVSLAWVVPPLVVLGAFGLWLWSGRRESAREAACAVPTQRDA